MTTENKNPHLLIRVKKLNTSLFLPLFLLVLITSMACSRAEVYMVRDGVSQCEIVIQAEADSTVQKAAQELSTYLAKASGAHLQVVFLENRDPEQHAVFVGIGSHTETMNPHTIAYRVEEGDLYIYGGNPKSTLYAVYRFLEKELGYIWLSPEAEKIPELESIGIKRNKDYSYTPLVETRTVHSKLFYEHHDFADKLG